MFWKRFKNRIRTKSDYVSVEEFNELKKELDLVLKVNENLRSGIINYLDYISSTINNFIEKDFKKVENIDDKLNKLERISKILISLEDKNEK